MAKQKSKLQTFLKDNKRLLIAGGIAAGVGTGLYLYFRTKPDSSGSVDSLFQSTGTGITDAPSSRSEFPLKFGVWNEEVRRLQKALVAKFGSGILPRFGADGKWGNETEAALKSKGLPTHYPNSAALETVLKSLSGSAAGLLGAGNPGELISTRPAVIWDNHSMSMTEVPAGVRLGRFVGTSQGVVEFLTPAGRRLYTHADSVSKS